MMGQPVNVKDTVRQAAERLQSQRDAAQRVSQQIADERAATASTEAAPTTEAQR